MKKNTEILLSIALMMGLINPAFANANTNAQTKAKSRIGISYGMQKSPYKEGKKSYSSVLPAFMYDNGTIYARGNNMGVYLYNTEEDKIAVYGQMAGIEFEADEADGVYQNLDDKSISIMMGLSYLHLTPYGGLRTQIAKDVRGKSKGEIGKLTYLTRYQKDRLTLYPSVGIQYQSKKYNDYYYGITQAESQKTGLTQYEPKQSVSPYLGLSAIYDINPNWALFVNQDLRFLSSEEKDSPRVDKSHLYNASVGVFYQF